MMDSENEYVPLRESQSREQSARRISATNPKPALALIAAVAALGVGISVGGLLGRHAPVQSVKTPSAQTPAPLAPQVPVPQAPARTESPAPASSLELLKSANSDTPKAPETALSAADMGGSTASDLVAPQPSSAGAPAPANQPHLTRTAWSDPANLWARQPAGQTHEVAPSQASAPMGSSFAPAPGAARSTGRTTATPRAAPAAQPPMAGYYRPSVVYAGRSAPPTQVGQAPQSVAGNSPFPASMTCPGCKIATSAQEGYLDVHGNGRIIGFIKFAGMCDSDYLYTFHSYLPARVVSRFTDRRDHIWNITLPPNGDATIRSPYQLHEGPLVGYAPSS